MSCPHCKKEAPPSQEVCYNCGFPIKPLPMPPGGKIKFGKYDWYVLDKQDDRTLIITEKVIDKRTYHNQEVEVTWEKSDLRKYLNREFYNSFSTSDRMRIIEVINENNDNQWYGTNGGNPTTDRIFLLSIEEVVKYFGDSGQLKTKNRNPGCDWLKDEYFFFLSDQYDLARRAVDDAGRVFTWSLRSPGGNNRLVAAVLGSDCEDEFDHGDINISGGGELEDGFITHDDPGYLSNKYGIRPALWLRMPLI